MDKIRILDATLDDLARIQDYLARIHFDVGVHILQLYFLNSQPIWKIGVNESNEIVFFDSAHELPIRLGGKLIQSRFVMYVREDYQGRGVLRRNGLIYKDIPAIGNATARNSKILRITPTFTDMKILHFMGRPAEDFLKNRSKNNGLFDISKLENETDTNQLITYDRSILDIDRSQFMRQWCTNSASDQSFARTLVARSKSDRHIIGFGTLRRFSDFYCVMPLYANEQSIAEEILWELMTEFLLASSDEKVHFYFQAKNQMMMKFVHQLHFEHVSSLMRNYYRGAEIVRGLIDIQKVYAIHEYWPI